jgi:hypothetical protein
VFALANRGDEQIDRLVVVPRYLKFDGGPILSAFGRARVAGLTASQDRPERVDDAGADTFQVTLDPGAVITYVAELRGDRVPQLYVWEPDAYRTYVGRLTFYCGIATGVAGVCLVLLIAIAARRLRFI